MNLSLQVEHVQLHNPFMIFCCRVRIAGSAQFIVVTDAAVVGLLKCGMCYCNFRVMYVHNNRVQDKFAYRDNKASTIVRYIDTLLLLLFTLLLHL